MHSSVIEMEDTIDKQSSNELFLTPHKPRAVLNLWDIDDYILEEASKTTNCGTRDCIDMDPYDAPQRSPYTSPTLSKAPKRSASSSEGKDDLRPAKRNTATYASDIKLEDISDNWSEDSMDDDEDVDTSDLSHPDDKTLSIDCRFHAIGRRNIDNEVLKYRYETRGTPLIRKLAGTLFGHSISPIEVEGSNQISELDSITCDPTRLRRQFEESFQCKGYASTIQFTGTQVWYDGTRYQQGFGKAIIDGETYHPGDFVMVLLPIKTSVDLTSGFHQEHRPSTVRFARLLYFYQDHQGKHAHVRWFAHGSKIPVLRELAAPRALFLLSECEDIQLSRIGGKIKVDHIIQDSFHNSLAEIRYTELNHFFFQFCFDKTSSRITDVPTNESNPANWHKTSKFCNCCNDKQKEDQFNTVIPIGKIASDGSVEGCRFQGVNYYVDDFVYGVPEEGILSELFQISEIKFTSRKRSKCLKRGDNSITLNSKVHVRVLDRADEHVQCKTKDNRKVVMTNQESIIPVANLDGKCQVRHLDHINDLDKYKEDPDNFWVKDKIIFSDISKSLILGIQALDPMRMRYSQGTELERAKSRAAKKKFLSKGYKVLGVDLFGGVGGLALGLHRSGSVETKHMVEFGPSSAQTAEQNIPWLHAHNEDISSFLKRAFEGKVGISNSLIQVDMSGRPVRGIPIPGEIYFISAGFPCPGYSLANSNPQADDIKNTLILPTLSIIELYRPAYVLLENVTGLLSHRLGAQQAERRTQGGIPEGSVKFIYRALTLLGYQVEYAVLQAGEYGTPQNRQRVIFWAALQGYSLPDFPQATNTFEKRSNSWHRTRRSAPHRGLTIADAIYDLPRFDWVNPHNEVRASEEERKDRFERAKSIEQIEVLQNVKFVGHNEQNYTTSPQNEFQRNIRNGVSKLTNHVTKGWFDKPTRSKQKKALSHARTEQVCNIGMKAGTDHTSLPKELKPWYTYHADSAAKKNNFYKADGRFGRLDAETPFPICLTTVNPNSKNGRVIHPNQHRVLSVREYARAQGFPDSFKWDLDTFDTNLAYRMIGNAVPPPLAEALGRELLKTLVSQFERGSKMPLFTRRLF